MAAAKKELPVYIQRKNCTEDEVNKFILLGYTPWQITPITEEIHKNGRYMSTTTELIYHFLRRKTK